MRGGVITVRFQQEEKRFLYPDAFREHLAFKDGNARRQVNQLLDRQERTAARQRQAEFAEQARQQRVREFRVSVNSQAAFDLSEKERAAFPSVWIVSTGTAVSGSTRGQVRIPEKLRPNSACLLTSRPSGGTEAERQIWGAFLVPSDFLGDECTGGVIAAHPDHRLLPGDHAMPPFWSYFPGIRPRWGCTAFKYFSNRVMQSILADMVRAITDPGQRKRAESFYDAYCRLNCLWAPPRTKRT